MKILILHGPNLNLLGKREEKHYGTGSPEELKKILSGQFPEIQFDWFQSNHEGALIDRIHQAIDEKYQGLIVNFGGLTHSSVSLRDALHLLPHNVIEVHLSNIHARESFRHTSITAGACIGQISGFGFWGYKMAAETLERMYRKETIK